MKLGLSQAAFAERYGFSIGRIRDWEQGRSNIDTPSRILLTVIDKEPDAIERALAVTGAPPKSPRNRWRRRSPPVIVLC
jgi:transcriptional regulator with XRE-family HTH domain